MTLGEVCEKPQYGWTTSASQVGSVKLLRTTDISKGRIDWSRVPYCQEAPSDFEKYLLHDGDIVVSRAGSVGLSYRVSEPEHSVFASYLIRFRPLALMDGLYLSYFLQSPAYWAQIASGTSGIAVPNVNATKLALVSLPVPERAKQVEIASHLDLQTSRMDHAVRALEQAQTKLAAYRASVLKAACEGRLVPTEAELARQEGRDYETGPQLLTRIRGSKAVESNRCQDSGAAPVLPEGWALAKGHEIFTTVTSGSRGWAKYYSSTGALFVRMTNLNHEDSRLDLRSRQHVKAPGGAEGTRTFLLENDIVISITADVGMVGLVPPGLGEAYINQHVALARPSELVSAAYIAHYLGSSHGGWGWWKKHQRGATKVGLGLDDIRSVPIPLPPLAEQIRIVAEVERRLSVIDQLEATVTTNLQRATRLRQSILEHVFRRPSANPGLKKQPEASNLGETSIIFDYTAMSINFSIHSADDLVKAVEVLLSDDQAGSVPTHVLLRGVMDSEDRVDRFYEYLRDAVSTKQLRVETLKDGTSVVYPGNNETR